MIAITGDTVATGDWFIRRFGTLCKLTAHPGQRDLLVQHLLASGEHLAQGPGCYVYLVSVAPHDPDVVWVSEAWRSEEHRKAALDLPAVQRLWVGATALIAFADEPVLTVPVGGKGLLARMPVG